MMIHEKSPPKGQKVLTLCVLLALTLLCSLGGWQLSRSYTKQQLLTQSQDAFHLSPLSAQQLLMHPHPRDLAFSPIKLKSSFLNNNVILLDNKTHQGLVGYHVVVPLLLNDTTVILVNRGWLAMGHSRQTLPIIPAIHEEVMIEGYIDAVHRNPFISQTLENPIIQWPLRVQQLDIALLENIIGKTIYPMVISLTKESPYVFEPVPAPGEWLTPQRHMGYAVQWFSLAITLGLFYFFCFIRMRKSHASRN